MINLNRKRFQSETYLKTAEQRNWKIEIDIWRRTCVSVQMIGKYINILFTT